MARSLVIVESATKAPTINRYLGRDFVVKSSAGHVRDLPVGGRASDPQQRVKEAAKTRKLSPKKKAEYRAKRARTQLVQRMGVDPDHDWAATYEVIPGKEKVVKELKSLAARSEHVYLATDLDREGEAIAWHLMELLGGPRERYRRVVFNEITRRAVEEAFADPGEVDIDRVNAQQARRFLDRVVGFEVSPLLWSKVARGLSAGPRAVGCRATDRRPGTRDPGLRTGKSIGTCLPILRVPTSRNRSASRSRRRTMRSFVPRTRLRRTRLSLDCSSARSP